MAVAYSEEINSAMSIESFAFKNASVGNTISMDSFEVYMGLTDRENLSEAFEGNYLTGSKTLVLQSSNCNYTADEDEWCIIPLDTPFLYEPGHHLLLEFIIDGGSSGMHNYVWDPSQDRAVLSSYSENQFGYSQDKMIHLLLSGTELSLNPESFGSIKVILGSEE